MKLQKIGAIGSIGALILVIIMLTGVFFLFPRFGIVDSSVWYDAPKVLEAMSGSFTSFFVMSLTLILVSITFLLIVLGIKERMQESAPILIKLCIIAVAVTCALWTAAGSIGIFGWSFIAHTKDISSLNTANAIYYSFVFAGDSAAGWVLLLIGLAGLKTGSLPKTLSYLSIIKAIIMIIEIVFQPFITSIIGMLLGIPFYPWLAIVLFRNKSYLRETNGNKIS